jgi:hypothetical protein
MKKRGDGESVKHTMMQILILKNHSLDGIKSVVVIENDFIR